MRQHEYEFLEEVKMSLRIKTDAYDDEISDLINAAFLDLGLAGVKPEEVNSLVKQAVKTYCKVHFGLPDDADRLKRSYDEQKAQMQIATGYTEW